MEILTRGWPMKNSFIPQVLSSIFLDFWKENFIEHCLCFESFLILCLLEIFKLKDYSFFDKPDTSR